MMYRFDAVSRRLTGSYARKVREPSSIVCERQRYQVVYHFLYSLSRFLHYQDELGNSRRFAHTT